MRRSEEDLAWTGQCDLSLVPCRYGLKPDVRESLYDYCNQWVEAIGSNRQFMGGSAPNLADLVSNNLYGVGILPSKCRCVEVCVHVSAGCVWSHQCH